MWPTFYIYKFFLSFIQKRVFWGSKKISSQVSGIFWPFWPSKFFLKLELF